MGLCLAIAKDLRIKKKVPEIPEEVLIEILIRLPTKSLMRFKCVSKLWFSLISSPHVSNLFLKHSSSRQCFFMHIYDYNQYHRTLLFTSTPTHDQSVSVFDQDLIMMTRGGLFMNAIRGLACIIYDSRVQIWNPNTKQFVILPQVRSNRVRSQPHWYSLGYDHVHDEYKVLSLACDYYKDELSVRRSEHQVLVLGPGASWRSIKNRTYPHKASLIMNQRRGISINGVLYYDAWDDKCRGAMMSFDLISEESNLIETPSRPYSESYVNGRTNYKGKLALLKYHCNDGILDMWVLEDAKKSRWSDKKTFVLPLSQMNPDHEKFHYMHDYTSYSGKIWFRKDHTEKPPLFFIYDLEKNVITQRIQILESVMDENEEWFRAVCWNDIESIMYLEI